MKTETRSTDWWSAFYEDTPFDLHLSRVDDAQVQSIATFLWQQLRLDVGSTVFDQCCGLGNISLGLAQKGAKTVGVDLCGKYIKLAAKRAAQAEAKCDFHQGDAFEFAPQSRVDGAFNWWTSFGYSDNDSRNVEMLKRAFEALKPGGYFCLDYPNIAFVLREAVSSKVSRYEVNGQEIIEMRETEFDLHLGLRRELWTFVMPDGKKLVHDTALKMYLPNALADLLRQAGFVDVQFFGDVDGRELTYKTPRCICVSRKPL